ncbi:MAG TPA: glycerophosphodiester phosphodiesterase family protein [Gemmatimonadales bacterium]|nr:glycerophosphodiester phosphodiesterase family protein [Gemmatimonadales bacterium]
MNPLVDLDARPVIGHRGAPAYAPENTLESFREAVNRGADALELDVRRSADGVVMVCHDPTLDRTTDRVGLLGRLSAADLAQVDAGFRFTDQSGAHPFRRSGVRIPTLRAVIEAFPDVPLLIELKEREVQGALARLLLETGAASRAVLAADDWRALVAFRQEPFLLGASRRDIARLYFRLPRPDPRCRAYAVPERFARLPVPTRRFVRAAHERQAAVHVWTVEGQDVARRLWRNGVNGIVTDRPDLIRAARDVASPPMA